MTRRHFIHIHQGAALITWLQQTQTNNLQYMIPVSITQTDRNACLLSYLSISTEVELQAYKDTTLTNNDKKRHKSYKINFTLSHTHYTFAFVAKYICEWHKKFIVRIICGTNSPSYETSVVQKVHRMNRPKYE